MLGVAWFRIASAALLFAPITKPWRTFYQADTRTKLLLIGLGFCLAVMNTSFYLALDLLPMSLVAAMEFVGTIGVALWGARTLRNLMALIFAIIGITLLIDVKWSTDPLGLFWAGLNAALFIGYIILGHKAAEKGASSGVKQLGTAMMIAFLIVMPIGFVQALNAFSVPTLVLAGIGVGICSSVIPYICDQLAMSRLPLASFALLLALLPATATIIAALVLTQIPTAQDVWGVLLVMVGIAVHKPAQSL